MPLLRLFSFVPSACPSRLLLLGMIMYKIKYHLIAILEVEKSLVALFFSASRRLSRGEVTFHAWTPRNSFETERSAVIIVVSELSCLISVYKNEGFLFFFSFFFKFEVFTYLASSSFRWMISPFSKILSDTKLNTQKPRSNPHRKLGDGRFSRSIVHRSEIGRAHV